MIDRFRSVLMLVVLQRTTCISTAVPYWTEI